MIFEKKNIYMTLKTHTLTRREGWKIKLVYPVMLSTTV